MGGEDKDVLSSVMLTWSKSTTAGGWRLGISWSVEEGRHSAVLGFLCLPWGIEMPELDTVL